MSTQFQALQRYLTTAPSMRNEPFETSIGYPIKEHGFRYADAQISKNVGELAQATVKPFTIPSFFAIEAGGNAGQQIKHKILEQFGNSDFVEIQKAIDSGKITEEQINVLQEKISDQILEILGPFKYLAVDIPLISDVENAVVDLFIGDEIEELRQYAAEFELPEDYFEVACEAP